MIGNGFRLSYSNKHFSAALRGSYRLATNYRNNIDNWVYNTGFQEKICQCYWLILPISGHPI
jgi:iron complex outermembrane receptor protein